MKRFIRNTTLFLTPIILIAIVALLAPPTEYRKNEMYMGKLAKDSMLMHTPSPRLILIGGSNVSFGINSQLIKDNLHLNPINTAIHAGIGLDFMLSSSLPLLKEGDIVVVMPEYQQFYNEQAYGQESLLRTVFDVSKSSFSLLNYKQVRSISNYLRPYIISKTSRFEYEISYVHLPVSKYTYNEYGDAAGHWKDAERYEVHTSNICSGTMNTDIIEKLHKYITACKGRNITVYMSFPGVQRSSFEMDRTEVDILTHYLKENNIPLLGDADRYLIPNEMLYDTQYHLTKEGVDYRTGLLIDDLKKVLDK